MKYTKIKKNKIEVDFAQNIFISKSLQDRKYIVKEFNSLPIPRRRSIKNEFIQMEKALKLQLNKLLDYEKNEDVYITCQMVNLNIVANDYEVDPETVLWCLCPPCKEDEGIMVVP